MIFASILSETTASSASSGTYLTFMFKMLIALAGVFVIAVLTPKIAKKIDQWRGREPEYDSPERVDEENSSPDKSDKSEKSDENGGKETPKAIKNNKRHKENSDG